MSARTLIIGATDVEIPRPTIDAEKELADLEALAAGEGIDLEEEETREPEKEEVVMMKCLVCGEMFEPKKASQVCCSQKCGRLYGGRNKGGGNGRKKAPEFEGPKEPLDRSLRKEGALDRFVFEMKREIAVEFIKGMMAPYSITPEELA